MVFMLGFYAVQAQERCGTVHYTKSKIAKKVIPDNDQQFERWIRERTQSRKQKSEGLRSQEEAYIIPVVVHIIHNGEPIGADKGTNISDEQVLSQIQVLNDDFKRLNADAVNTPAEFKSLAASMNITFVLAKQDPDQLPTTGIVRVKGTKSTWTMGDDDELKALSYWPAEDYYNIWVCNIPEYLGYTQFPYYDGPLDGLEAEKNSNRLTDGVVINYLSFGSIEANSQFDLKSQYNRGRTLTHETGHFLGLKHIWGDDQLSNDVCSGTDYVDDTPNQGVMSGSGSCDKVRTSCGFTTMFQNYMDYTDDKCMNLFTADQVYRMTTILENSIRRTTLLTSHGLAEPIPVPNDLKLSRIISPRKSICNCPVGPTIEVLNYGTNDIISTRISIEVDSVFSAVEEFTLNLAPGQKTTLSFSPYKLSPGVSTFTFNILRTNGGVDENVTNNKAKIKTTVTAPYFIYYDVNASADVYVKFNFSENQTVRMDIIDTMGKVISNLTLTDVLDQTYPLNLPVEFASGVYILRLSARQVNNTERILIRR